MSNKQFSINLASPKNPLDKYWELCVGSCHAVTALRKDYQQQLARCQREIGFRYVRFHGLFDDDMSVVLKNRITGQLRLSFTNIDAIFDFLLSINMKPFIELGFTPKAMKSGETTVFHYGSNTSPPNSQDDWAWLIEEFASHLVQRYGRDEVRQWFFEVWNEPNLGGTGVSEGFWGGTMEEYFTLYRTTALALKKVDASFRVGGPASSNNAWIPEMVDFCKQSGTPIDFISTHHYPTDVILGYGVEDSQNFMPPVDYSDPEAVAKFMQDPEAEKKINEFRTGLWRGVDRGVVTGMTEKAVQQADGLPVYYTEWNSLAGLPSDGPFGASFIAKTVLDAVGLVQGYSYWTFTDIFEEGGMPSAEFHGGFGLLTLHGVPKASYRAFQLLHRLGESIYQQVGRDGTVDIYTVEKQASSAVQLFAINHHSLLHNIAQETAAIALSGLPGENRTVKAEILRVDDTHGNAIAAWEQMGSPEYVTPAQLAALNAASELEPELLEIKIESGNAAIEISLPPMGMALATLYL